MPTLIRLIVILLVLVGIGYGAMFGLVMMVEPRDKDVTIRIPARDLLPQSRPETLVRREINTTRAPEAVAPAPTESTPPTEPAGEDGEVRTLSPGIE